MQNSFLTGEWSPFSQGRSREEGYYAGLNLCLNMIPTDTGALPRRSGTRFVAHAKTHDGLIRLIEFVSETGDALIVELTNLLARFHRVGQVLTDASPPLVVDISSATPAVVETATAHSWSTGDTIVFVDLPVVEAAPLFNRQFVITVLSATTFSIAHTQPLSGSVDGSTLAGAVLSPLAVARITERVLPYTGSQVSAVKYTAEEDTLYLFHPSHEIRTIERDFLTVTEELFLDGPYLDENKTATTLAFSGVSGSVTVTASSATGINDNTGFQTTDVGRVIRVNSGTALAPSWSWLRITARASATSITATILGDNLAGAGATTLWRLGVYSDTTGWPVHGVIHEQRLWIVGATGRIDGSKTFDFFNFEPTASDGTVADDNAVSGIFAGSGRQKPRWLKSIDVGLLAGLDGGEYLARASSFDDPITPFTLQVRRQSSYGVADVLPREAGTRIVFAQALARSVYEYGSSGQSKLGGSDIARDARHLTSSGISELAYVSEPIPVLWCLRGDKRLIAATYRNDDEGRLVAWHRHTIHWDYDVDSGEDENTGTALPYLRGGQSTTEGLVYTLAAAPFSDPEATRNDTVWVAVLRGTTVCVELMAPIFDETFIDNEAFFVDSGNIYRQEDLGITWVLSAEGATNTYTFYGLDRLNGKTIDVSFRGVDLGTAVVASGGASIAIPVELDSTASAYETVTTTDTIGGTLSFSSGFISELEDDVIARPYEFAPQYAFVVGEDGELYYPTRTPSADTAGVYMIAMADGTLADSINTAGIQADIASEGVAPPSGWTFGGTGTPNIAAFSIAGSPYIIMPVHSESGLDVDHGAMYYKMNAAGALVLLGGFAEDNTGIDWQFVPSTRASTGNVNGIGFLHAGGNIFLDNVVLLADAAESKSMIIPFPSVAYIIANSPENVTAAENIAARTVNLTALYPTFDNVFRPGGVSETPIATSQAFFLPGPSGNTYCFSYVGKQRLVEHAAATATDPIPAVTTRSAISTDPLMIRFVVTGSDHLTVQALGATLDGGVQFENFPFADVGETFAGTAGTNLNDYGSASVFPSDPNDSQKPWFVFFPRFYADGTDDIDKLGIAAYLWDPNGGNNKAGYGTFLSFAKGKLYDVTIDGLPANQSFNRSVSIYWDRVDNNLYVISGGVSVSNNAVSQFGTFEPTTGAVTTVDEAHIDGVLGCNYRSRFQLLRPDVDAGAQNGPALGKTRRIDNYSLLAYRTGSFFIGADDFTKLDAVVMVKPDTLGRRPLFTGVFYNSLSSDYNFDNMTIGEFRRPVAGAIAAISGFLSTQDR